MTKIVEKFYFKILRIYQILFSPILGRNCRFYPTCSNYSLQAVKKYGILKGGIKSLKRVFKCHPFNRGGVDLP